MKQNFRKKDADFIRKSYNIYYKTGLYSQRYPKPNPGFLKRILSLMPQDGGCVLDFGCGDGRYALPIAAQTSAQVICYDPSPAALEQLAERAGSAQLKESIRIVDGPETKLWETLKSGPRPDLALLAFGVLGHIRFRAKRLETLRLIGEHLNDTGKILLTAPNINRRFPQERRNTPETWNGKKLEPGDILYKRQAGDIPIKLFYHLYSASELYQDLQDSGFRNIRLSAESIQPESMIIKNRFWNALDQALKLVTPVNLAYGIVAVAEK